MSVRAAHSAYRGSWDYARYGWHKSIKKITRTNVCNGCANAWKVVGAGSLEQCNARYAPRRPVHVFQVVKWPNRGKDVGCSVFFPRFLPPNSAKKQPYVTLHIDGIGRTTYQVNIDTLVRRVRVSRFTNLEAVSILRNETALRFILIIHVLIVSVLASPSSALASISSIRADDSCVMLKKRRCRMNLFKQLSNFNEFSYARTSGRRKRTSPSYTIP